MQTDKMGRLSGKNSCFWGDNQLEIVKTKLMVKMIKNWTLWGQGRGTKGKTRQKSPVSFWSEVGRRINQMALRKMKSTCCIAQKVLEVRHYHEPVEGMTSTADVS